MSSKSGWRHPVRARSSGFGEPTPRANSEGFPSTRAGWSRSRNPQAIESSWPVRSGRPTGPSSGCGSTFRKALRVSIGSGPSACWRVRTSCRPCGAVSTASPWRRAASMWPERHRRPPIRWPATTPWPCGTSPPGSPNTPGMAGGRLPSGHHGESRFCSTRQTEK